MTDRKQKYGKRGRGEGWFHERNTWLLVQDLCRVSATAVLLYVFFVQVYAVANVAPSVSGSNSSSSSSSSSTATAGVVKGVDGKSIGVP